MTDTTAPTLRRLSLAEASEAERRALTDRASTATPDIRAKARAIVDAVRDGGDAALRDANARFGDLYRGPLAPADDITDRHEVRLARTHEDPSQRASIPFFTAS